MYFPRKLSENSDSHEKKQQILMVFNTTGIYLFSMAICFRLPDGLQSFTKKMSSKSLQSN